MFGGVYSGKRVLVTGHTGFKGSWLTAWLLQLGAQVSGVSKDVPTQPALFEVLGLKEHIRHHVLDIRDAEALRTLVTAEQPDFVFHLAAQAIVSTSYADPLATLSTNAMGTAHLLEALRALSKPCAAVLITSDKAYDNVEWPWGYRETDALGGKDVYSGSKGAAELVIKSYRHSFFKDGHPVRLGVGRAGNVIGGGDWARDRIVADCMRAWSEGKSVEIRSPRSTRPWQHVLEPLSGYLALGQALAGKAQLHGEAFNFGPAAEQNRSVLELLTDLAARWEFPEGFAAHRVVSQTQFHEAGLLKLNCDKALLHLGWQANLEYEEMIRFVGDWYARYYQKGGDARAHTAEQIDEYQRLAAARNRPWAA